MRLNALVSTTTLTLALATSLAVTATPSFAQQSPTPTNPPTNPPANPPANPSGQAAPQQPPGPPPTPCVSAPRRREFDFWIGTWDVYPWAAPIANAPLAGVNVITSVEQGCVILEMWTGRGGGTGRSLNWYDRNTQQWRQLWVDQFGGTLDYNRGEYRDGAMRFEGVTVNQQGQRVLQKLTFFNIHPDTVRQLFEASSDSGKTWTSSFDGRYVRRRTE